MNLKILKNSWIGGGEAVDPISEGGKMVKIMV